MSQLFWRRLLRERTLVRAFFALRGLMLIASAGAILGAILMFWSGGIHLFHAYETLIGITPTHHAAEGAPRAPGKAQVVVYVLEAVDSFLFALVLMIFAYGIALGFVFHDVADRYRHILPSWMLVEGVGQLKRTLAEVVIVVLIVIFARIVIESGGTLKWEMLVLPVAVLLLALALRVLALIEHGGDSRGHGGSARRPAAEEGHNAGGPSPAPQPSAPKERSSGGGER